MSALLDNIPMNRDQYFDKLYDLFVKHIEAPTPRQEEEAKKQILRFCAKNQIHPCEFCNGKGVRSGHSEIFGDYDDAECDFCKGTGSDIELETK